MALSAYQRGVKQTIKRVDLDINLGYFYSKQKAGMKQVTIVIPDGDVNLNSVVGAYDILVRANELWQQQGKIRKLRVTLAGFVPETDLSEGLFRIRALDIRKTAAPDLVIIPSIVGDYEGAVERNAELILWIGEQYKNGAELASMCSGAFLLAATGLLHGRSCSIHWNAADRFHKMYPDVKLAADRVITDEKGVYTNGGAFSFLNLVLYLVEKLFDRDIAILCSKIFQIDMERTTQSPFAIFHGQKEHDDGMVREAQAYLEEHVEDKISFEKLAAELAVSRRNFDRRFIKATGNTPVEYLQRVKVEAAKKELERGRKSVFEVMSDVGYADHKAFREVFKRIAGLSPQDYRNRYSKDVVRD